MIRKGLIVFGLIYLCFHSSVLSQPFTAKEIVKKADDKGRGQTNKGDMVMTIVRPNWSRSVGLKSWQKGTQFSMILITSPAKEKGQVFLKIRTDMWNWVPSIDKMIKIPPSMMMQSWMGSDFTNDDLVKESSAVNDYTHKLIGQETIREKVCYKIEMIPLPEATVTWGKVIVWITLDAFDNWKVEYYDEEMKLINIMNAYNIKKMGDREIPTRLEIFPVGNPGNKTILETISSVYNQSITDDFFSQQNMKRLSQMSK